MDVLRTLSVLLAVLLAITNVGCQTTAAITISEECVSVQKEFVRLDIGHPNLVPDFRIHDPDMEICYKGSENKDRKSCCSRKMERKYVHSAEKNFHEVMKSTSTYLKNLLSTNAAQYQERVLDLLSVAENKTQLELSQMYKLSPRDHRGPIDNLFLDLRKYVKRREVNIHESVTQFFDELFPQVYHYVVNKNPSGTGMLTDEYRECLTGIRQGIQPQPFGDIPHKLSHELSRSLSVSKLLLEALGLGIETVNTTDHLKLDPQCVRALTRLKYCSHCDVHVGARPCHGFCLNVMRGCLSSVTELDAHWNSFVDALQALTNSMKGTLNVELVLRNVHNHVSSAVMHAMDTGPKFYAKVVSTCGHPKTMKKSSDGTEVNQAGGTGVALLPEKVEKAGVGHRVDLLMRNLVVHKGFYHSLADTLCTADMYASHAGQKCWNGTDLAPYNYSVSAIGLTPQLNSNPEMRITRGRQPILVSLVDKLIHIKKLLASKVSGEQMQADSYSNQKTYYYSSGYGAQGDDEDSYGSGSGSGDQPEYKYPGRNTGYKDKSGDSDITIVEDQQTRRPPTGHHTQGVACSSHYSLLLLITAYLTSCLIG